MAMSRSLKRLVAVVVPIVVLALTPAATSAGGPGFFGKPTTSVSIKGASLAYGGAVVTLRYNCFPGGYGPYSTFGDVRLADTHGNQSFSFFRPTCNDTWQTTRVFVSGNFTPGDAAVEAFICGFDCNGDTREVHLK